VRENKKLKREIICEFSGICFFIFFAPALTETEKTFWNVGRMISAPTPWGVRFFRRGTYHVPGFNEAVSEKSPRADDIRPYTLGYALLP